MAGIQQTVRLTQGYGVPGELVYDAPHRSNPWEIISSPHANIIGATAYTILTGATDTAAGTAQAGGTASFCGILANPKVYANTNGNLAATLTLPDNTVAELVTMGTMLCTLATDSNPGDLIAYDNTTGALSSVPAQTAFTASSATSVLTVTGTPVGVIGPGLRFKIGGDEVTIVSNGTGTGGAGTYNLSVAVGTVASAAYVAENVIVAATQTLVPHAKTVLRSGAANGVAIVELTD